MEINDLPPHSRVWIYQSSRPFSSEENSTIQEAGNQFIDAWTSHGNTLEAVFKIEYNRFIVLAVDETNTAVSGCSIDKSVKFIQEIEFKFQVNLMNRLQVAYEIDGEVKTTEVKTFKEMLASGKLNRNSIVFNNLVNTLVDFQENWRTTVDESWHKQLLETV